MAKFGEDFLLERQRKQAAWGERGIRAGSGRPFGAIKGGMPSVVPGDEAVAKKSKGKAKSKQPVGAKLGDPGYTSPHAVAMAYLGKHPEAFEGNQEFYEQCRVFATIEAEDPELYELMAAVPNGGYRTPKAAGERKAEGQKSGYPDIVVDLPAGVYHGARLEMKKAKGGRVSPEQAYRMRLLTARGYYCALVDGADEALTVLRAYRRLQPNESMNPRERDRVWMESTEQEL